MTNDQWSRPPVGRAEYRNDAVLAAVLTVLLAISTVLYGSTGSYDELAPWWLSALLIVANAAPLAFRRRFPMTVAVVVALTFAAMQILHVCPARRTSAA